MQTVILHVLADNSAAQELSKGACKGAETLRVAVDAEHSMVSFSPHLRVVALWSAHAAPNSLAVSRMQAALERPRCAALVLLDDTPIPALPHSVVVLAAGAAPDDVEAALRSVRSLCRQIGVPSKRGSTRFTAVTQGIALGMAMGAVIVATYAPALREARAAAELASRAAFISMPESAEAAPRFTTIAASPDATRIRCVVQRSLEARKHKVSGC